MSKQRRVALVTGASSGLGKEYCIQLATRCDVIIAVARRLDRLQALSQELQNDGVTVHCIEADLATDEGLAHTVQLSQEYGDIAWLVNNAGVGAYGNFIDQDLAAQQAMINLHIKATIALSHTVIPQMQTLGKGTIINVASLAAHIVMPAASVYGASKRFIVYFSQALQEEVRASGIKIQCLSPVYIQTEFFDRGSMHDYAMANINAEELQSAEEVVAESLAALDSETLHLVPGAHNRQMLEQEFGIKV